MHAQRECQLEIWEVEKQKKYFKKIFGYGLQSKVLIEQGVEAPLVLEGNAELEDTPEVKMSSKN